MTYAGPSYIWFKNDNFKLKLLQNTATVQGEGQDGLLFTLITKWWDSSTEKPNSTINIEN